MKLFVDASAIVAIIAREDGFEALAERLASADQVFWSAMSCWESIVGLRHANKWALAAAREEVEAAAAFINLQLVDIGEHERREALQAYHIFGKGRHPAKLNMGDCFAYACAKTNDAALLYKGEDFAKTDLA